MARRRRAPHPHLGLGEVITDPHSLPGLPAGRYQIRVGLYGPDGERMSVTLGPDSPPDRALSFPLEVLE